MSTNNYNFLFLIFPWNELHFLKERGRIIRKKIVSFNFSAICGTEKIKKFSRNMFKLRHKITFEKSFDFFFFFAVKKSIWTAANEAKLKK